MIIAVPVKCSTPLLATFSPIQKFPGILDFSKLRV